MPMKLKKAREEGAAERKKKMGLGSTQSARAQQTVLMHQDANPEEEEKKKKKNSSDKTGSTGKYAQYFQSQFFLFRVKKKL